MDWRLAAVAAALIGLTAGYVFAGTGSEDAGCKKYENELRQNQSFKGTVACYPPGEIETNVSGKVEDTTQLQCVCRRIYNGKIHDIGIRFPG